MPEIPAPTISTSTCSAGAASGGATASVSAMGLVSASGLKPIGPRAARQSIAAGAACAGLVLRRSMAPMTAPGANQNETTSRTAMNRVLAMYGPAVFAGALATRATDPLVVDIAADLGSTAAQVALLGTAYTLPFALVQPILGPIADSVGKRRVVTLCVGLLGLLLLLSAVAASLGWLMAFRALSGAAAGGMMPLTLAIMADAVPMRDRQVALSRMLVFGISGQIAGGAIAGPVAAFAGWRGMLVFCAIAAVIGLVALVAASRGTAKEPVTRYDPVVAAKRYRTILSNPQAIPLYATVAAEGALVFGSFPFIATLMLARGIGGTTEAGLVIGAFGVGGLGYAALARPLLVRFGQAGVVRLGGAHRLPGAGRAGDGARVRGRRAVRLPARHGLLHDPQRHPDAGDRTLAAVPRQRRVAARVLVLHRAIARPDRLRAGRDDDRAGAVARHRGRAAGAAVLVARPTPGLRRWNRR